MKKLLLLGALALASMTAKAATVEGYLDREGWTVTACSWINEGNGSGPASCMIDDNLSTYYHQNWSSDTGRGTHWFIIDMGSEQEIHGLDIWGRQNHVNGHIEEAKIYLSNTEFAKFDDHDAAKAYYDNEENVPVASINYEYAEATRNDVQSTRFESTTARYILVVTNKTSQNHLCIAEVKAFGDVAVPDEVDLDRSNWVATACSEAGSLEGAVSGRLSAMFDDDLSTYYHQNWSSDKAADAHHWFIIDLGKSEKLDGFKYWRRQGNQNGQILAGKVYVSNEPFTAFADHDASKAYLEDEANVPAATYAFTYDENPNGVRVCNFDKTVTGRYVLVVVSDAGMSQGGRHLCCAEFKLFKKVSELEGLWNAFIDHDTYAAAQGLSLLGYLVDVQLPSLDMPDDVTAENINDKVAEFNSQVAAYRNAFNGLQVVVKNPYRRAEKPYMAAVPTGNTVKMNTVAAGNPDAVWEIRVVDEGIQLYNRTTGFYIGAGQNAVLAANAQSYTLRAINGDYIAFAKGSTNNLLNIDTYGNDLTSWSDLSDQGSSWEISLANAENNVFANPEVSTADAPKYYRIVNARWMSAGNAPCMAVNGENQNGNGNGETNSRGVASFPGIYWRAESAGQDGGVKLVNLTGYELTFNGQNATTVTDDGSIFYLLKQTDAQFDGINAYGISGTAEMGDVSCLDAAANGVSKVCWNPVRENKGNGNNGSAWYFILATDSEIATATQTYIAGVKSHIFTADNSLIDVFGPEFYSSLNEYNAYVGENTIPALNAAKASGVYVKNDENVAAVNAAVNAKVSELTNRQFLLRNCNTAYSNCYMTVADDVTAPTADASDLNALWSFVPSGEGYLMTSVATGHSLSYTTTQSAPIPVVEDGLPYSIAYNANVPGFYFTLMPTEEVSDVSYFSVHQSNNTNVCKWIANNIAGSHWTLEPSKTVDVEVKLSTIVEGQDTTHYITLPEGVVINPNATEEHVITITLISEAPEVSRAGMVSLFAVSPVEGVHTIAPSDFVDGTATLTGLKEGNYKIEAPAGMFLINGKPSAAFSSSFYVDANGGTTDIRAISANAAREVIFDLQGRRVNGSAKGLLIINGKKTYRK